MSVEAVEGVAALAHGPLLEEACELDPIVLGGQHFAVDLLVVEVELLGVVAVAEQHEQLGLAERGELLGAGKHVLGGLLFAELLKVVLESGAQLLGERADEGRARPRVVLVRALHVALEQRLQALAQRQYVLLRVALQIGAQQIVARVALALRVAQAHVGACVQVGRELVEHDALGDVEQVLAEELHHALVRREHLVEVGRLVDLVGLFALELLILAICLHKHARIKIREIYSK